MTEISDLPPEQRAERYRALANAAKRHAKMAASDGAREAYDLMASQWAKLADEAEGLAKKLRDSS